MLYNLTEDQLLQISMIPMGKSIWMNINKIQCLVLAKKFTGCTECFLHLSQCRLSKDISVNKENQFSCPCNLEGRTNRKMFSLSLDVLNS